MRLTLTVLRCPDTVTPETRTVTGDELTVGRGPGVGYWVLADPKNLISRRHFTVTLRAGDWRIVDESSNGTYLNREEQPIGKGNQRRLRHRDRLRVGPYEIEVQLAQEEVLRSTSASGFGAHTAVDTSNDPFADPVTPDAAGPADAGPLVKLDREDHPAVTNGAIPTAGHVPSSERRTVKGAGSLSGDRDNDLSEDRSRASPLPVAPTGTVSPETGLRPPHSAPVGDVPSRKTPANAADTSLLEAFLAGVGLPDAKLSDPAATLHTLGQAFRALVAGVRSVLIARASVKSEFRIEQTMIRARGNNPIKFAASDDDAVSALLGVGRRSDMAPATAVIEALRDIRLHELASMAAMQSAIRALMAGLDPEKIRLAAEQGGGKTLLPGQRKARAWDAYAAHYARTSRALSDDFDSAFGKAFARAYEEALDELTAREQS